MRITITIPAETIRTEYAKTLKSIVADFTMDGFRKGAVPEHMVVAQVGSLKIWEESLREAIPSIYIQVLTESKIPAIGRPSFAITKIADQADAEVAVTTAVLPDVTLPDYKSIAKEVYKNASPDAVSDEDIQQALFELRKLRMERDTPSDTPNNPILDAEGNPITPEKKEVTEADLPELTPEYLAGFGPGITSVSELESKLRHNLEHERIHQFEDKKRSELITKILEATTIETPQILVEHEIDIMIRQYEHDLSMSGISLDDYLKYTNKTRTDLRSDVAEAARKRASTQIIIEKIANVESITADPERITRELAELKNNYKDNTDFNEEHAQSYLEQVYTNQALFAWLEKVGGYETHDHAAWDNHTH